MLQFVSTRIAGGFLFRASQALNRLKPIIQLGRRALRAPPQLRLPNSFSIYNELRHVQLSLTTSPGRKCAVLTVIPLTANTCLGDRLYCLAIDQMVSPG